MEKPTEKLSEDGLMRMTADVVSAYVGNNSLPTAQLADLINGAGLLFPQGPRWTGSRSPRWNRPSRP